MDAILIFMRNRNSLVILFCTLSCCSCKKNSGASPGSPDSTAVDIYLAGYVFNGTNYVATYWKNGVQASLADGSKDSRAFSICVSGSDVYVAGAEYADGYQTSVAKYWKNGIPVILSSGSTLAIPQAIAVSGNDVYVVGIEQFVNGY
ncbi:MAG TPA: hypothetical protein VK787_11540, partial [Puia sp.]|nr:hypothetical protein [Puia sp.]